MIIADLSNTKRDKEMIDFEKAKAINVTVRRYFKAHGISHKDVAQRLGYASVSAVDNQLSYRWFGKRVAEKWAKEFGFNMNYLMTGKGNLVDRQSGYQKLVHENEALKAIVRIQKSMLAGSR